jgi:predicted ATPase/DNA-binding CsgD family transcriptional regulator/Tfp pilus assembly protein PilF
MSTAPEPSRNRGSPISVLPLARSSRIGAPPTPLTPLIGRQHERARAAELVEQGARLVTLTGPGGVGKTRLALQLAMDLEDNFADGLAWVPLATVRVADAVMPAIAQAVGVHTSPSHDLPGALIAALRDARLLLILDNVEQVLPATAQLGEMLRACPELAILTTSRSLLRVSGEHAIRVPPLAVPASAGAYAELVGSEAVQLFSERARAVSPNFTLDAEDARNAAAICARLDGLPLAIELAAARVSFLPLPALSARLGRRLPLLTDGAHDQPARLRTMRDAIAWSYDLLNPREQAVFRGVAIHAGGFRIDAVVTICARHQDLALTAGEPPELDAVAFTCIRSLTDHSLVHHGIDPDGEPRFIMLETIREFALEQLDERGERPAAEHARADYLATLLSQSERRAGTAEGATTLALIDHEQENIREALSWLTENGDAARAVRLAGMMASYWFAQGYYQQGRSSLEHLLDRGAGAEVRAEALVGLGYTLLFQGESARAKMVFEDALRSWQEPNHSKQAASALMGLGVVAGQQSRYEEATELLQNALALGQTLDDPAQAASIASLALSPLGTMAHALGNLALARDHHTQSLALRRQLGDTRGASRALADLGSVAVDRGDYERALEHFREALTLAAGYENPPFVSHALVGAARVTLAREQPARAARLLGAADALRGEIEANVTLEFEHLARDRACASARAALGDEAFASAVAKGRVSSLDDAIAEIGQIAPRTGVTSSAATVRYGLTPREVDVLKGIVDYLTDREIAERLFISRRTVGWHVTGILNKLTVDSRRQAATKALDEELI